MNFRIQTNQEIDKKAWADFVSSHPNGNIFQTPEMFDFFLTIKNHQPLAVACVNDEGIIQGILASVIQKEHGGIIGKLSSRAIVWGGPLLNAAPTAKEVLILLLAVQAEQVRKKTIYLEFRNLFDLSENLDIFIESGFAFSEHLNFRVQTAAAGTVEKNISSSRKRQIKKSLANGVEAAAAKNLGQVEEFYNILNSLYKNKVRKPLPDWSFFRNFYLAGEKLGVYLLVIFKGKVIGGIMCPLFLDKTIYEWYVCGLDSEYPEQYPSVMATWAAIDYALKNGIKYFDFMGAGAPDQDYGVREFKARFGGELVNYGRFIRINNRFLFNTGKSGLKILATIKKV
jgi:serine/alanine adding enzyme